MGRVNSAAQLAYKWTGLKALVRGLRFMGRGVKNLGKLAADSFKAKLGRAKENTQIRGSGEGSKPLEGRRSVDLGRSSSLREPNPQVENLVPIPTARNEGKREISAPLLGAQQSLHTLSGGSSAPLSSAAKAGRVCSSAKQKKQAANMLIRFSKELVEAYPKSGGIVPKGERACLEASVEQLKDIIAGLDSENPKILASDATRVDVTEVTDRLSDALGRLEEAQKELSSLRAV